MTKLSKDFFSSKEVVFIGYSGRNQVFSRMVYQAFVKNGLTVYPINKEKDRSFDIEVYNNFSDLPKIPEAAYVLLRKQNSADVVSTLKDNGIKKVLFHSNRNVDQATLNKCEEMGIETAVGCPMMVYGKGLHKLHAFFKGIK